MNPPVNPILLDIPSELTGERIVVKAWREEQASALWEAVEASRAHLSPWMPWVKDHASPDASREYVRRMLAKWALREDLPMGIWTRAEGRLVGSTGLHHIDWSVPSMEIGYWLRTDAVGHGYTAEAVRLVAGMAFEHLKAERLTIRCSTLNARSAAVPPRCGFTLEATLRHDTRTHEGALRDTLLFALLRAERDRLNAPLD